MRIAPFFIAAITAIATYAALHFFLGYRYHGWYGWYHDHPGYYHRYDDYDRYDYRSGPRRSERQDAYSDTARYR